MKKASTSPNQTVIEIDQNFSNLIKKIGKLNN